jgi:hypothetical protein
MSHRPATSARVIEIASRTDATNPAFVEGIRRKVQDGLPYGGGEAVRARLAGVVGNVEEQLMGRNRLTVAVLVEALRELPRDKALEILDDLTRPLDACVAPRSPHGASTHPVAASGALLESTGNYSAALGRALADGSLDAEERIGLRRQLGQIQHTLDELEHAL